MAALEGSGLLLHLRDFVYTAFTGATDPGSHLPIVNYAQATSRFVGTEASVEAKVATTLWLNAKVDYVRAELTELNKPLPRIPPLRGTLGLDWRYKQFSVRPEMVLVDGKLVSSIMRHLPLAMVSSISTLRYTFVTTRVAHILSLSGQNLTDKLYRNHLSFN